jgi:hypothetical protein
VGHHCELHKEITLAASPEQVWDAIATGPGVDAWFMGRTQIEPREGGTTSLTLGGHTVRPARQGLRPGALDGLTRRLLRHPPGTSRWRYAELPSPIERAISIRITSLVPSPISRILASR